MAVYAMEKPTRSTYIVKVARKQAVTMRKRGWKKDRFEVLELLGCALLAAAAACRFAVGLLLNCQIPFAAPADRLLMASEYSTLVVPTELSPPSVAAKQLEGHKTVVDRQKYSTVRNPHPVQLNFIQ